MFFSRGEMTLRAAGCVPARRRAGVAPLDFCV